MEIRDFGKIHVECPNCFQGRVNNYFLLGAKRRPHLPPIIEGTWTLLTRKRLMDVGEAIQQKQQSNSEKNYQSHFCSRLAVYFRYKV